MKKLLAILLALILVLVNVAALANDPGDDQQQGEGEDNPLQDYLPGEDQKPSIDPSATTYTINKAINIRDKFADAVVPADANFKFEVAEGTTKAKNSDGTPIDMSKLKVTIANDAITGEETVTDGVVLIPLTLTLPTYPVPGIYEYDIEEQYSDYAGMTYADELKLKITVIWDSTAKELKVAGIAIRQSGVKVDEIENEYAAGDLKVTKVVSGNFGDVNKKFPITISFTADRDVNSVSTYQINGEGDVTTITWSGKTATVEVELANDDYVLIKNLPEGVKYTVVEDDEIEHLEKKEGDEVDDASYLKPENPDAYMVDGEVKEEAADITVSDTAEETITNTKNIDPDTGIVLDSLPYVLLMALAAAGFMMKARKREDY